MSINGWWWRAKAPASRTHSKRFATKYAKQQIRASVWSASGLPALSIFLGNARLPTSVFSRGLWRGRCLLLGGLNPILWLLFVLAVLPTFGADSNGEDWPRFLGPNGNGISRETGLLDRWTTNGPPLLWDKSIGTGYGAPSVRGAILVVHHRLGDEEIVECVDAASGKPRWRYAYPSHFVDPYGYNNGPRSTPLLTSNRCYTLGAEGKLLCLDLDGRVVWQRDTGVDWNVPPAFFGVGSTPLLEGNLLLVMVGGQTNSGMVALEAQTGKTVWESVGQNNWEG